MLKVILFLFELSYLSRFLWDQFLCERLEDEYKNDIVFDICLYIDVLPFIGLLLFHRKNFKQRREEAPERQEFVAEENHSSMGENEGVCFLT